jgi:hypothetical protein
VIVFLFLTPLLLGIYFIYINPPRGTVELDSGEDTFVSSSYEQEYSSEHFLRISNYSQGSEEISEVGFFEFFYIPPPGGGGLVDVLFSFHCGVVSMGEIGLHIIDADDFWDPFATDFDNLTYSSMPPMSQYHLQLCQSIQTGVIQFVFLVQEAWHKSSCMASLGLQSPQNRTRGLC